MFLYRVKFGQCYANVGCISNKLDLALRESDITQHNRLSFAYGDVKKLRRLIKPACAYLLTRSTTSGQRLLRIHTFDNFAFVFVQTQENQRMC